MKTLSCGGSGVFLNCVAEQTLTLGGAGQTLQVDDKDALVQFGENVAFTTIQQASPSMPACMFAGFPLMCMRVSDDTCRLRCGDLTLGANDPLSNPQLHFSTKHGTDPQRWKLCQLPGENHGTIELIYSTTDVADFTTDANRRRRFLSVDNFQVLTIATSPCSWRLAHRFGRSFWVHHVASHKMPISKDRPVSTHPVRCELFSPLRWKAPFLVVQNWVVDIRDGDVPMLVVGPSVGTSVGTSVDTLGGGTSAGTLGGTSFDASLGTSCWKFERYMTLRDLDGALRTFVDNGMFKHSNVFVCISGFGFGRSNLETRTTPILLMAHTAWDFMRRNAHDGAFGRDFRRCKSDTLRETHWVTGCSLQSGEDWYFVWKFPLDLHALPGYRVIRDTPLPVGTYLLQDDCWHVPARRWSFEQLQLDEASCVATTKYRIDCAGGQEIHYLYGNGTQVAVIATTLFIQECWKATNAEKKNIVEMLQALYANGLYAFPCYTQHQVIVFYADMKQNALITPTRMSSILSSDNTVCDIMRRHIPTWGMRTLRRWRDNYVDFFRPIVADVQMVATSTVTKVP
jgi:hypothetical protein